MSTPLISVVIPVYKSAESLEELAQRLATSLSTVTAAFEVILVNDGSPDNSWDIISKLAKSDNRFIGICLSRNFGQHPAITAGLNYSKGEWIVVMDCDLQDQPEEIPRLFEKAQEGFEQVVALRHNRQDSFFKRVISRLFYNVMAFLTETKLDSRIGNYGIYSRKVIDSVMSLGDKTRTFSILVRWVGFSRSELVVEHASRPHGASAYSIRKLYSLGLQTILGSSEKPLRLTINFGFGVSIASLLLALSLVVRRLAFGVQAVGWTSTVVLLSFMFGVVISCIGIVGLYVGRIFEQTKDRPVFIIDSTTSSFPGSRGG